MSATQDKSQKIAFVYSNLYRIYREGAKSAKEANVEHLLKQDLNAPVAVDLKQSRVLKTGNTEQFAAQTETLKKIEIRAFAPAELIGKRLEKPAGLKAVESAQPAVAAPIQDLKQNIQNLTDLHGKLRFLLKEIQDIMSKKSS